MKNIYIISFVIFINLAGYSQHDHHMQKKDYVNPATSKDSMEHKMEDGTMDHDMSNMSHAFSLNLPMSRNGSGTAWLPDASPMYGNMFHASNWMFMLHGNFFIRYNNQDFADKGIRGNDEFDAPNWLMFMGQRKVGNKGLFHFNTMFSLDALTGGNDGYPLLFQSGEAYRGKPLVDRQHPHDLFSELSVSYSYAISRDIDAFLYLGYPGEPALGPTAFMHRPSALYNPDAPLSHHWIDATHITFGVATFGFRYHSFKIEASSFTGREPNEERYDFDKPKFDSWSSRLSFNPSNNWALQVSHGYLNSPEELHPDENINRTTASVNYSLPLSTDGSFDGVVLWGLNKAKGNEAENAFLIEGSWQKKKLALHSRYEYVQKSVHELNLDEAIYGQEVLFPVNAFTLGINYDLLKIMKLRLQAGSQITFYKSSQRLETLYGENPMAFEIYLRLFPDLMKM
ncbi:MAG TPA: hypothetical protein VK528_07160 [Flavobacterium sp.]|nr:hypothetical protein [Flavobacterium sp.]